MGINKVITITVDTAQKDLPWDRIVNGFVDVLTGLFTWLGIEIVVSVEDEEYKYEE